MARNDSHTEFVRFVVPDITCAKCCATITKGLKAIDGVKDVDCDELSKVVRVDYKEGMTPMTFMDAIRKLGYTPRLPRG